MQQQLLKDIIAIIARKENLTAQLHEIQNELEAIDMTLRTFGLQDA